MAIATVKAALNRTGTADVVGAPNGVAATVTAAADYGAVNTAIGVLVADGALPTQAHVNTLNSAWTTLKAAIIAEQAAAVAAAAQYSGGVAVSIDLGSVATISKLRRVFNSILTWAGGDSQFTA